MKRSLFFLLTLDLCLLYIITSCVRDVILDAGEAPQVVVECVMSNDSIQKLNLCFTKGASKKEAKPLTEADAVLTDITDPDSLITIGRFIRQEDNSWTLDYNAVPGHHYRLEVQVPGYDLIWAEDTMPGQVYVREHRFAGTHNIRSEQPDRFLDIPEEYAYFFDGTYYEFGEDFLDPLWVYGIDSDYADIDERDLTKGPIAAEIYTDLLTVDKFNIKRKSYLPELQPEYTNGERKPNAVYVIYPDLIGSLMHDRFLRINGGKKGDRFIVNCNFKQWWDYSDREHHPDLRVYSDRCLKFMSLSEVYDQYLKTALIMEEMQNSSDMSAIYLRDNLPSNIHGGIGVFGGKFEWYKKCFVALTYVSADEYPKYGIDKETHKYIED